MNEEIKYKRGFPTITLNNFPKDLELPLFKIYAKKHLDPASASFMEGATEKNLRKRVYKMILNAIIVEAVVEGLNEFEISQKASQGKVEESQEALLGSEQSQRSSPFGYLY